MDLTEAKAYLQRMERNREQDEPNNKKAYEDARTLAGFVSLVEFGNPAAREWALNQIKSI